MTVLLDSLSPQRTITMKEYCNRGSLEESCAAVVTISQLGLDGLIRYNSSPFISALELFVSLV